VEYITSTRSIIMFQAKWIPLCSGNMT